MTTELGLLLKYLFLGLLQGFTEPIPISSSGHVLVLRDVFNLQISGMSFEMFVNFGSFIAILVIYQKDITRLIHHSLRYLATRDRSYKADFQFVCFLFIATLLTGIIGLLFEDLIHSRLSKVYVVGITLLITGSTLWIIRNLRGNKNDHDLTTKDAIIIGFAQSIALIPGISRSGATIVAAMLLGMKQETALRFSFLLYIPISMGVSVLSINDIIHDSNIDMLMIPYLLAFLASIITTFFALKWFMHIMEKGNLKFFSFYCFTVGILIILFSL